MRMKLQKWNLSLWKPGEAEVYYMQSGRKTETLDLTCHFKVIKTGSWFMGFKQVCPIRRGALQLNQREFPVTQITMATSAT